MNTNTVFYEIVIDAKTHKLISADADARAIITRDMYAPFEENIDELYRELFLRNIAKSDNSWFPTAVLTDSGSEFYLVRAAKNRNGEMIKLVMACCNRLIDAYGKAEHIMNAYKAQLEMYEDVFFVYNPVKQRVEVQNTVSAYFDSGNYSLEEFEELLTQKANERQLPIIKGFINQIKNKVGRFSARVDGNILNEDKSINRTTLEGACVFVDNENEGVVGHIHLDVAKGKVMASSIKHDSLTGLVDKADIIRIASERIDERRLQGTTLAIIDIDFFKNINDSYGHQFGDTVIKKVSDIISTEVGTEGIVGRFGGDEYLIVFYNIKSEDELREHLRIIKNQVSATYPDKGPGENMPLSVSIGAAIYPYDADTYDDIFMLADHCLYIAKDKGRNRYIIYNTEKHGSLESIRIKSMSARKVNERDASLGDILVKMFDNTFHGRGSTPEQIMNEFAETFELQRITLFVGEPFRMRYSAGPEPLRDRNALDFMLGLLNSDTKQKYVGDQNFIVVNRIDSLPTQAKGIKDFLKEIGIYSYVLVRFFDKEKRECILIITSVGKQTQWNQMHYKFYRALGDLLSLYSLKV